MRFKKCQRRTQDWYLTLAHSLNNDLVEKVGRNLSTVLRQLLDDSFVQPHVQGCRVRGVSRIAEFGCEFLSGSQAAIDFQSFEQVDDRVFPIELLAACFDSGIRIAATSTTGTTGVATAAVSAAVLVVLSAEEIGATASVEALMVSAFASPKIAFLIEEKIPISALLLPV